MTTNGEMTNQLFQARFLEKLFYGTDAEETNMNNDRIVRWATCLYFILIITSAILSSSRIATMLHDANSYRIGAYNVGYMGMSESEIKQQINTAFNYIWNMIFFSTIVVWLIGFTIQVKYYRIKSDISNSIKVLLLPLFLLIFTAMTTAFIAYSKVQCQVQGFVADDITEAFYLFILYMIIATTIPYLLSTAIMAIFYRRKG